MSLDDWNGVSLDLACDDGAPRAVRAALRDSDQLAGVMNDVLLVASELVALVVRDNCVDAGALRFGAQADEVGVMLRVHASHASHVADAGADGDGGGRYSARRLGLQIVDRLAERWDVEHHGRMQAWALVAV